MKLSIAVRHYEECMRNTDGCHFENCPLHRNLKLEMGIPNDEMGGMTWTIGGCTLMGKFEDWLKGKRPGKRYELSGEEDRKAEGIEKEGYGH